MITPLTYSLALTALLTCTLAVLAEEALTRDGKRLEGQIVQSGKELRFLTAANKSLPLEELAWVRLKPRQAIVPVGRLIHQLRLGGEQRLSGELLLLDDKSARFLTGWVVPLTVDRSKIEAIVQPDDYLALTVDGLSAADLFEVKRGTPKFVSPPPRGPERPSRPGESDDKCLEIKPDEEIAFVWKPDCPREGRLTLCFFDHGDGKQPSWSMIIDAGLKAFVTLQSAGGEYKLKSTHSESIPSKRGWHLFQLDWRDGEAKAFVDDQFLGSVRHAGQFRLSLLRIAVAASAKAKSESPLWIDDVQVAAKAKPLSRPPAVADQDELWLEGGDQIFGKVVRADRKEVVLDARTGKRSYAWSKVRGVYLRKQNEKTNCVEIWFRSGPGIGDDMLRGEMLDLDDRRLLIRHDALGELAIERSRLQRIVFPETKK